MRGRACRLWLMCLLGPLLLAGCASTASDPRARQPMQGFAPLPEDSRVWVEQGAEDYGRRVSARLDAAIAKVEAAHFLPFARPPRVYVCASESCFRRHVLTPRLSAAVIPDNRLILSPKLDGRESWRLQNLMVHELAHLHLGQRVGHYHYNIPVWFHEGWASLAAEGGGADYATDEDVYQAIRAGRRVNLATRDTRDRRHRANASGLGIYEFYRQSMLLVRWLKTEDEARFRALVLAIQANTDFHIAFWDVYGQSPSARFAGFFDSVLADAPAAAEDVPIQAAPAQP